MYNSEVRKQNLRLCVNGGGLREQDEESQSESMGRGGSCSVVVVVVVEEQSVRVVEILETSK
jgi:hypothetical protein